MRRRKSKAKQTRDLLRATNFKLPKSQAQIEMEENMEEGMTDQAYNVSEILKIKKERNGTETYYTALIGWSHSWVRLEMLEMTQETIDAMLAVNGQKPLTADMVRHLVPGPEYDEEQYGIIDEHSMNPQQEANLRRRLNR